MAVFQGLFLTIIFIGIPLVLAYAARSHWTHVRYMKALELRAEAHARLVDRFGADPNFLEYLKAEGQQTFLDAPLADPSRSVPALRMLTALQVGFLLVGVGVAFLWVRPAIEFSRDQTVFLFFGVLGVALGIGCFCAALAAFVVGRYWGTLATDAAVPGRSPQTGR